MDAYLDLALEILRTARRPLSPRAILAAAYRSGLVPPNLYGKTQHKTLQARLSEDIIARRERSQFFRTAPGRFFLREFLTDTSIPDDFRRPISTKRRIRELVRGPALAIDALALAQVAEANTPIEPNRILEVLTRHFQYEDPRKGNNSVVFLRSFVSVFRDSSVLTYRLGRYRDDRDAFMTKRSVGFSTLIFPDDHTLFSIEDFGILDSGVQATKIDLDFPEQPKEGKGLEAYLAYFIWARDNSTSNDLLAVIGYRCPRWFEPMKRRLALNDLLWMSARSPVNNIDDFDPWSKRVLLNFDLMNAVLRADSEP